MQDLEVENYGIYYGFTTSLSNNADLVTVFIKASSTTSSLFLSLTSQLIAQISTKYSSSTFRHPYSSSSQKLYRMPKPRQNIQTGTKQPQATKLSHASIDYKYIKKARTDMVYSQTKDIDIRY